MSKPTCYRKVKTYKTPKISEPSSQEKTLARWLTQLNEELEGLGYKYVVDRHSQLRPVLVADLINNSSFWEAANRLKLDEQCTRTSASPDSEKTSDHPVFWGQPVLYGHTEEDVFFDTLRKVNERSTYGMYCKSPYCDTDQLTIDDVLKEDK